MSDAPSFACKARFLFERVFAGGVQIAESSPPREAGSFLRVMVRPGRDYPERVHVCIEGLAVSTAVELGGRKSVLLRNIRCRIGESAEYSLTRCAACGFAAFVGDVADACHGSSCCGRCKAPLSTLVCGMWHTWGVCEQCSPEKVEPVPFAEPKKGEHVDANAHVG